MALVICLLTTNASYAQRYPFFNIGIEQGLVQSQVFALAQDASGHLWSGTLGGLSCYDGHSFRSFTVRSGLPSNTITALCCAPEGILWIGTSHGLSRYDGRGFRNYTFSGPDNPGGNRVLRLSVSPDGTLWAIAGKSLYRLQAGKLASVPLPRTDVVPNAIFAGSDGEISLGCTRANSLYRFTKEHWDSTLFPHPISIYRIFEDRAKRLILLTSSGMYRRDEGRWNLILESKMGKAPLLYSFAEAKDGSYWMSMHTGVVQLFKDGSQQHYAKYNGLSDVFIYDILSDREGNIWLASNGEGLFRFSGATFTAVDERMGLTGPQVSSIARDTQNNVYFGSYDGGLYRYTDGKVSPILFPEGDKYPAVGALMLHNNTLWIGTQTHGLWQYKLSSRRLQRYADDRIGYSVPAIIRNEQGIWLANSRGVALINHDSLKTIPVKSGVVETLINIGQDSILFATSEGLMLYHDNSVAAFMMHSAADSAQIVCLDYRQGTIWLGTVDDGVFGYSLGTGKSLHISRKNGLRSNFIYNIYAAPDGYVWAGTGYGICRIRPDGGAVPAVTFYGRSAGITGMESNRNAVLPLPDGSIWFGTTGGALLYHPANTVAVTRPVSLQLQAVQLFGEPVRDTTWYNGLSPLYGAPLSLRLPWRQNNLSFSFGAVSLTGYEGIVYRYHLAGLNAPWSDWSANTTVNFSALPPGMYTLEVQCSTDGNTPQPQSLRYRFEIITPFQKTALFRLLIIAACILLGVALQYIAARRKRARLAMIEALRREEQAKVRQRTAEDFHDEVGNKITRINVLTNVLRSKVGTTPDATRIIDQIQDNTGQLYSGTRDILWSLQPANDSLYQVLSRIRDFGRDLFGDTELSFDMQGIQPEWKEHRLPIDMSRNLIMIFKEALNNALKYSMADQVHIEACAVAGNLILTLSDDGKGFETSQVSRGQGLINMKTRAARLGGTIQIDTASGKGTTIQLILKIPSSKG